MNDNLYYEQQIKKIIMNNMDELLKGIKAQIPSKMRQIRSDIYANFLMIVKDSYVNTFQELYGSCFDQQALINSLNFYPTNDLRPDFSYDIKKFKFINLRNNIRKFNPNSVKEYERTDMEEIYQDYDEEIIDYDEFEEYDNSYSDFTPNNKVNIGGMIPLTEAYEQAKYEALNKFQQQYITQIQPRIFKRYGIKLAK